MSASVPVTAPVIVPVGDRCLLVRLGDQVDGATSARVHALVRRLRDDPIPGVRDTVPAFTTVALHYQPEALGPAPFDALAAAVRQRLRAPLDASGPPARVVDVPVCYDGELAPDLADVAARLGLSTEAVIALHLASPHRVHMLGFAPGFPFIGGLDPRLALPRRSTPRTQVPAGSVAIARDQTCVYPLETPGGWNLIGRTPLALFDPQATPACRLAPGDAIRFVRIDAARCAELLAAREAQAAVGQGATGGGPSQRLIEVVKPGAQSQLQDLGRHGHQHLGVPVGGAMDELAHRVANRLVGNPPTEATLEIVLMGPTLRFTAAAQIALCGADLSATLDGVPLPLNRCVDVPAGAVLACGRRVNGLRSYLAVRGGFDVPAVMGSLSTFVRGGFGGFQGRALRKGDALALRDAAAGSDLPPHDPGHNLLPHTGPDVPAEPSVCRLRVLPGEHWDGFTAQAQADFTAQAYRISPQSDRMGYRLEGPALWRTKPGELISEAVAFGSIQVPPDGQPIVLMAERQSAGGYPKIAHVIAVDLPLLAQMAPQQALRFEMVTLAQAHALYLEREHALAALGVAPR